MSSKPVQFGVEDMDQDSIFESLDDIARIPTNPPTTNDRQDSKVRDTPIGQLEETPIAEQGEVLTDKPLSAAVGEYHHFVLTTSACFLCLLSASLFFQMLSQRIYHSPHHLPRMLTNQSRMSCKKRQKGQQKGRIILQGKSWTVRVF